jgi:hypothetical protein
MRTAIPIILAALASASCLAQDELAGQAVETILAASQPRPHFNAGTQAVFQALASLARTQGLDPDGFTAFRVKSGFAVFSGGAYSMKIRTDDAEHILIVQTVEPMRIPGTSAQQLVLLDRDGKILDRLQCHINSRYGVIVPVIKPDPEADGSHIIIRFKGTVWPSHGTNYWHNWHTIGHAGAETTFQDREEKTPNEWDEKGLARIGIRHDRFDLLFPQMKSETPEEEASQPASPPYSEPAARSPQR